MRLSPLTFFIVIISSLATAALPDFSRVPGTVISYEPSPSFFTRYFGHPRYIGSPSLAVLPNGHYVATHDLFTRGGGETETDCGITKVFLSTDRGGTWTETACLKHQFWSTVFYHEGYLYLLGPTHSSGNLVIRRSADEGRTWTEPTDERHGLLKQGSYGSTPNPPVIYKGRLWLARGTQAVSIPVDADLLDAGSWAYTPRVKGMTANRGVWLNGQCQGLFEGQITASPQHGVVVLPVVVALPKTALVRIPGPRQTPQFDPAADFVDFPGGEKKFGVAYDGVSGKYYAATNPAFVPGRKDPFWDPATDGPLLGGIKARMVRNAAALFSSTDLRHWGLEQVFLYHPDAKHAAFQYLNFVIEGMDLLLVSRTAFNIGAHKIPSGHDSNLMTFHRIENFRQRPESHFPREFLVIPNHTSATEP